MPNKVEDGYFVMDCGCKFKIKESKLKHPIEHYLQKGMVPPVEFIIDEKLPDCKMVWEMLGKGLTKGVFQLESNLGKTWCKKLKPENIEHMAALGSILRPGCMESKCENNISVTEHYCRRKNKEEEPISIHPAISECLRETFQLIIYQENALRVVKEIANFTDSEADSLRKACVSGDTIMMTNRGPITIKDLHIYNRPFKLLTCLNGKNKYSTCSKVINNGVKSIYRIKTSNGFTIRATLDHEIFTQDGFKQVKDITDKDFVCITNDYIYKGCGKHINVNKAIISAYFIGEGCYTEKCEPKITNSDKWILDLLKYSLDFEFGKGSYREQTNGGVTDIVLKNAAKQWVIDNFSKLKSRYKQIPKLINNSFSSVINAFVGSYFSGEGDVSVKGRRLAISSTSLEICQFLQILLLRNGIHAGLSTHNSIYNSSPYISYRVNICNPKDVFKFLNTYRSYICPSKLMLIEQIKCGKFVNERFLIPKCFTESVAGTENLHAIFGKVDGTYYNTNITYDKANRINKILCSSLLKEVLDADYKFVKIESVDYDSDQEVFDFQVPETECAYANGILIHNCGKKIPEEMAKVKAMFLEKSVAAGKCSKEEAEKIFSNIEASQRYSFNKCLSPDTIVELENEKFIEIKDVQIGNLINTPEGFCKILDVIDSGKQEIYEITLESGSSIKCTLEHEFLCEDNFKRKLKDIIIGDFNIMCQDVV